MSSTNLLKILLLVLIAFALGEIIFTIQRYGLPKIDIFKPKPGSCKILEEKYCKLGKFVEEKNSHLTYIGINLPAGSRAELYAAANGHLLRGKEGGNPFNGSSLIIDSNPKDPFSDNYAIRGNIDSSKFGNLTGADVKSGDVIGYAESTSVKSLGYDIVMTITKATPAGTTEVVEDKLKTLFNYQ